MIKFFGSVFIGFPSDSKGMLLFIVHMVIILLLIETIFVIIKEMFHGSMSVKLIPLLLVVVNFVSGSSLELIHIFLIINIRPTISHLYGFQLLVLLLQPMKIASFVFVNRINPLHLN